MIHHRHTAFTLVELMVTIVILAILSSLALAGMAGARQRAKIDKTRSTIRKLHEIVVPQYESYARLRVSGNTALTKLQARRLRIVSDLPDQWNDIQSGAVSSAASRNYLLTKANLTGNFAEYYQGAECLALIVLRGGFDVVASENFRSDEIGDVDQDGAVEFLDGWGMPIRYIRWPAGFSSVIQPLDAGVNKDPMDPMRVSGTPPNDCDYGLTPLIYSAGPDGASYVRSLSQANEPYGITGSGDAVQNGWLVLPLSTTRVGSPLAGSRSAAAADNITNHDLMSKR